MYMRTQQQRMLVVLSIESDRIAFFFYTTLLKYFGLQWNCTCVMQQRVFGVFSIWIISRRSCFIRRSVSALLFIIRTGTFRLRSAIIWRTSFAVSWSSRRRYVWSMHPGGCIKTAPRGHFCVPSVSPSEKPIHVGVWYKLTSASASLPVVATIGPMTMVWNALWRMAEVSTSAVVLSEYLACTIIYFLFIRFKSCSPQSWMIQGTWKSNVPMRNLQANTLKIFASNTWKCWMFAIVGWLAHHHRYTEKLQKVSKRGIQQTVASRQYVQEGDRQGDVCKARVEKWSQGREPFRSYSELKIYIYRTTRR